MMESLPGGCWEIRVMTATRLSQKLLSKTCNLSFPQRGTGVSKENTTHTFIACGTLLKTPFYTSSAGVELPLGTQRIPHPLSLLFKSGAYLCGQMCLHKLVSTLSSRLLHGLAPMCTIRTPILWALLATLKGNPKLPTIYSVFGSIEKASRISRWDLLTSDVMSLYLPV